MERKIISHRIGSILDDISRLSNALYAMDTTDIQRYPDNYEVLSTDAALRAEKIACRLRHLIYSSTTIHKGDYLTSAGIVHGIEVVYEDGVLEVTLPGLLPKRKQRQNTEFLLDPFYFSLEQYAKEHPMPHFSDCVVCFTQVYDQCLPTRRIRDYDNLEEKQLLDVLSTFVIIKNTTNNGKSDHFWDACEMNLLKALVLYVDQGYAEENRNIGEVYRLLTLNGESQLDTLLEALPSTHPAKAPYSLFKQASDTVRSGVIIGLGSRLQVFQSELIKKITAKNEIDLELPGQQPCAYFLVTSDQDSTFDFLASLFLSFCFIKLVRYADHNCEGGKLPVPVHILGEELTACGTIPDLSRRLSVIRSRNISMSCVFQNLAGLQNRYPQNLWQEIIGNCDAQLFLGCTDQLTAEFISARTGLASVAVSSKSKQLGTWRISNYTPEFRETSGVGKRPVLTPDEVLRLPLDQALIIIRGKKVLQVDKMDYSKHPEAKYLRSCKASAHVPEWRRLEEEAAKTPQPAPKPAPAAKKPAKRKATKPASPTDKSPKEAPAPKSAGTPEGIITTDKDSILS